MNWKGLLTQWPIRYGFAVLSVALVTVIKLAFEGDIGPTRPFFFMRLSVLLTAYFMGLGPALVALILSALSVNYFFLLPRGSFELTGFYLYSAVLYVLETSLLLAMVILLRHSLAIASQKAQLLTQTEERLRVALRGSQITVSNCDADLRHVWVYNPPEGLTEADIIGKTVQELRPGEPARIVEIAQQQVLDTGVAARVDVEADTPEGMRYYEVRIEPQVGPNGKTIGVISAASDVTEHKKYEQAVRAEEARFQQLADSMPQIVWAARPDGYIDYWNRRWYEFAGFREGEGGDESWLPVVHTDDVQPALNQWYRSVNTGEPLEVECRLRDLHAGEYRWFLNRAVPVRDTNGNISRWYGTLTDMHDYRALIEAVSKSEERFRSLVRATAQIVWTTDAAGDVEDMPEWRMLTGQTVEQVQEYGWINAVHPDDREATAKAWEAAKAAVGTYAVEYRIRMADGTYRWFSVRGVPVRDGDGTIREWVGLCVDVEEQKRAQEQMQHAAEAMAVARDAAVQANRAKSVFLANISHELRTPLNAILGYSEILLEDLRPLRKEQMVNDAERIHTAGNHLLAVVNDLLDISKIEAGRMTVERSMVDIQPMIDEVYNTVLPLAQRNDNALRVEIGTDPGELYTDGAKLRQVLFNLLSNACKFTESGTVTLRFRREQEGDADFACFAVEDTGIGISKDDLPKLFHEFTQLDASFTRRYSGTGLGLAICKRFVTLLGGRISVESEPGAGSTFTVMLPATTAERKPQQVATASAGPGD